MKKRIFNDYYEDIIDLPHHVSVTRTPMPRIERAAQFSTFAALTGHQEAVKETERNMAEQMEHDGSRVPIEEIYEKYENIFVD